MPKWFKFTDCCKCNKETEQRNEQKEVKFSKTVVLEKSVEKRRIYSTQSESTTCIIEVPTAGLSDNL